MIFRNDDINPNSNFKEIDEIYHAILERYPDARIISAVNLLAQRSRDRSAYAALKPADIDFAAVDLMLGADKLEYLRQSSEIASHGLAHLDHRNCSQDLQDLSIRGSCSILGAKIFVPPFLRANAYTRSVCERAGIKIMGLEGDWKNLDNEQIGGSADGLYCFHSWKMSPEIFRERLVP